MGHNFTSVKARALFDSTLPSIKAASYGELQNIEDKLFAKITAHGTPLEQVEAAAFLRTEIASRQGEVAPGDQPHLWTPEQQEAGHKFMLDQARRETTTYPDSERHRKALHGLENIERTLNGEPTEPYFENDKERERYEAAGSRHVNRIKSDD